MINIPLADLRAFLLSFAYVKIDIKIYKDGFQLGFKMGILDLFKKKDKRLNPEYTFTEDDQLKATIKKKTNAINRRLLEAKKEELEELESQIEMQLLEDKIERQREQLGFYDDDEEDSPADTPESLLMGLISKKFSAPSPVAPVAQGQTQLVQPQPSDEQLRSWKKQLPSAQLKQAKKLNDQQLGDLIKQYVPTLDQPTIEKAIAIVRE